MTNKLTILAPKLVSDSGQYRQRWQVAYDGRIMGDDRGYSTEADCRAEIEKRIAIDARDAVKYDRPVQYTAETPAMTDKPTPRIEIIERANMRKFGTLFEVVVNGAKLMRADGSARRYASREAAQKAGEAAAMTDKDDATHYLITPNGAVPVIADDEVHAMQIARQMGIANIVSRIDPAMTAAQWDAATVEDIKDDQDVRHTYATAPDRWADFLVTGNGTGLPMSERAAALAWVERLGLGRVVAADGTDLGEHAHHSAWQEWP
uniref:hypothetical protein n=1 Tax=Devosia sp. TaxID=1871048 RepID=UPI0037BF5CE1